MIKLVVGRNFKNCITFNAIKLHQTLLKDQPERTDFKPRLTCSHENLVFDTLKINVQNNGFESRILVAKPFRYIEFLITFNRDECLPSLTRYDFEICVAFKITEWS